MTTYQDIPTRTCPVCGRAFLKPGLETFDLRDILERWEKEAGVRFSQTVWQQYTSSQSRRVTLYHCEECEFSIFQPIVVGSQEFYSEIAERNRYVPEKWEFVQALQDLRKYRIRRILDVGCGSGYFLDRLQESGLSVKFAGYEFNSHIANQARTKGHRVYDGVFPETILSERNHDPFDAISMFQVLEHVADPMRFIEKIMPLLAPGGILIVGVPDAKGPVRHFSSALTNIPPHHVSRWCESVFQRGFLWRGFRVDRMAYEPLPCYLWNSYLPVILEKDILPQFIGSALNKIGMTKLLVHMLTSMGIKTLRGMRGHTLYVVLKRE